MVQEEKYNWNLQDLFKSESEFKQAKNEIEDNLKKIGDYKGILCDTAENLYNCYLIYEKTLELFDKVYSYGMFKYHLDMANQEGIKKFKEAESIATEFETSTAFIVPEITYADESKIYKFIEDYPNFKKYERDIKDTLEKKKHILTKAEEELLSKYSEVFSASENTFDILTNAEFGEIIKENGQSVQLTDATYTNFLKSQNESVRKQAFDLMYKKYSEYINTIAELYLSNVKTTAITSKIRKYSSSLERATDEDDASIKVYEALMEGVNNTLNINHNFISLKRELLKKNDFHMYDLYVNPFEEEKDEITFEEAKKEVLDALQVLGDEYVDKLKEAFNSRWIDVYEKPNKRGGAYSSGVYGVHPFVLMSFTSNKRDVSTIAHELGHSMHSYYSNKEQGIIDAGYTIMVAEVASTVNEILLSEYQIKNEKNPVKKAEIIYELLEMIRATFYRQSMFAEFEKIVHKKIENSEILSSEDLNNIYYELNEKYFGENIFIDQEIKYEWARIPHFYSDFYVYKYATGISAAICIATKILNREEGFVEKYISMLKQGRMKKSIDLLKMVDVDLESFDTYYRTAKYYEQKIADLKALL